MQAFLELIKQKESVSLIKAELKILLSEPKTVQNLSDLAEACLSDSRKGVQALAQTIEKKIDLMEKERNRMIKLLSFEKKAETLGFKRICGVDEVGRGPLVGPVVAAAVILDPNVDWTGIDDSKRLSASQREVFYEKITNEALAYGVGVISNEMIDQVNILNATKMAMKEAILKVNPDFLLIDAVTLTDIDIDQKAIIKGDTLSASIAAASIVAKVTRDRMMVELSKLYPEFDFENNKGYGTASHYNALETYGITSYHRRSFLKGRLYEDYTSTNLSNERVK